MAIGLRLKFAAGTQEQYNAIHDHLDIENRPPHGLIFHSSGPIDGGWGMLDFWHNKSEFDQFVESRLKPALAALGDRGFPSPPEVREFSVHNYLTARH